MGSTLRVWFLCVVAIYGLSTSGIRADAPVQISSIDSVTLTVDDADHTQAFFHDVLQFDVTADEEYAGDAVERRFGVFGARIRIVTMRLGDEHIELLDFLAPRSRPMPVDARANDAWFQHIAIITRDMDTAYAQLRAHGVEYASTEPQTLPDWNANAAGIRAFYFRDPDGHFLEVLQFPEGKGDPKWHRMQSPGDALFLGIDHSAIVVRDTEASLHYYRDQLGLRIAGTSENYGTEQEHLNNVFGARLRITTLRAASGPGIELLEYLAPRDGRPIPADSRASDLWHWHVNASSSASGNVTLISDPDGHQLLLGHQGWSSTDSTSRSMESSSGMSSSAVR